MNSLFVRQLAGSTLAACLATVAQAAPEPIWVPLGPELILEGEAFAGRVPVTGRIQALATNPAATDALDEVWIGAAGGGVWKGSLSEGTYWTPMSDRAESLVVGALALDNCTSDGCLDVWVGTGENGIRRDTQYGRGVLKGHRDTPQGDITWQLLGEAEFNNGSISRLLLDPNSSGASKVVYVALSSGLSSNTTHSSLTTAPKEPFGIWRSVNAGQSWELVLAQGEIATDLEMDPIEPEILFAALRGQGLFRSVDGGNSWDPMNSGLPASLLAAADWPELAVYRDAGMAAARLYLVLGDCPHPQAKTAGQPQHCSPAVFRSDDGGNSWEPRYNVQSPPPPSGEPLTTYVAYSHGLTIHPENSDELYFGGINLYRSVDGGKTWKTVGAKHLHPNHHGLTIAKTKAKGFPGDLAFLSLSDGGLAIGDGKEKWNSAWQNGLDIALTHSVAASGQMLLATTQGNGTNLYLGGPAWLHVDDGEAGAVHISQATGAPLLTARSGVDPRRCTGPGLCAFDWTAIAGDPGATTSLPQGPNTTWHPPMVEDPTAVAGNHRLYFAASGLYVSPTGAGTPSSSPSWSLVTPAGLGGWANIPELGGIVNPITAVAVAPGAPQRLYLGYYDGRVFTTSDALAPSPSWTLASKGLPARPVTALAVSPIDESTVLAAFNGFGEHSLYKSVDGGSSWSAFDDADSPRLAEEPVNALAIETEPPHRVWAATHFGVYGRPSLDGSSELFELSNGLPNVSVYGLTVAENGLALYAATHGRGVWRLAAEPRIDVTYEPCCGDGSSFTNRPFLAVSGTGFDPGESTCSVRLLANGTRCSTSNQGLEDALGARLHTDNRGRLVATDDEWFSDRPLAWACASGDCPSLEGNPSCPFDAVVVICGDRSAVAPVVPIGHDLELPPSKLFLEPFDEAGSVKVTLLADLGGGNTVHACEVRVDHAGREAEEVVLQRLADAVVASGECRSAGVTATMVAAKAAGPAEGQWAKVGYLALKSTIASVLAVYGEIEKNGAGMVGVYQTGNPTSGRMAVLSLTIAGKSTSPHRAVYFEVESAIGRYRGEIYTLDPDGKAFEAEDMAFSIADSFAGRDSGGGIPIIGGGTGGPPKKVWAAALEGSTVYFPHAISLKVFNEEGDLSFKVGVSH